MVGMKAQPNVNVPGFSSAIGSPLGATTRGVLMPSIQESVDPRGTVSGLSGDTVVVTVDVPLTTRSGRRNGAVATDTLDGPLMTGRSQPSVSVTRAAANIRRQTIVPPSRER